MDKQEPLTSEQRLLIIEQMISSAKGNFMDNSFQFLLWGWVIVIANLGHFYFMNYSTFAHPEVVWMLCIPTAIVSAVYGHRQGNKSTTRSYTDRISFHIWIACIVCIVTIIFFGVKFSFFISPMIMLVTGFATYLSGVTIKFTPLKLGGVIFWIASIVCFMVVIENQPIFAAIAIALGYLVPGYQLKAKLKNG